ncbi:MAG TPA: OmpA family protein, partial [Polyangia bacterium]
VQGDSNQRLAGGIAGAMTIVESWELFGAFLAAANRNERCADGGACVPEPDRRDPVFIRSFGDLVVGGKGLRRVTPALDLGVEIAGRFYAASDELGFDWDATSFWALALATWDLGRTGPLPVILHANFGYLADRSHRLASFEFPNNPSVHSRAVAGYAYGIGRGRLRGALALEAPITNLISGSRLAPFFEYQVERVGGSGDPAFAAYLPPRCGNAAGQTRCSTERVQQRVVLGLRSAWTNGLVFDFGVEIGAGSVGYPFGAPVPPWNIILGLGRTSRPPPTPPVVVVERTVEVPAAPKTGSVTGRVVDGGTNTPIEGAIVAIAGAARSRVATDPDGTFTSRELLPGQQELSVSAPGFEAAVVRPTISVGSSTPIEVSLKRATLAPTPETPSPAEVTPQPVTPGDAGKTGASPLSWDKNRLVLPRPIRFVGEDSSGTEPTRESHELLLQVAAALKARASAGRVRVEAHWDSSIDREAARRLTQQQADAIVRALVAAGVAADRLEAVGLGSSQPRGLNLGPLSRARNRRVEIVLVSSASR